MNDSYIARIGECTSYHFEEPDTTYREANHTSSAYSPVVEAIFAQYDTTRSGVNHIFDALVLCISANTGELGVRYENSKVGHQIDPSTGKPAPYPSRMYQSGYTGIGYFIVDLSDGKVKDAPSAGNGFYNGFFGSPAGATITPK